MHLIPTDQTRPKQLETFPVSQQKDLVQKYFISLEDIYQEWISTERKIQDIWVLYVILYLIWPEITIAFIHFISVCIFDYYSKKYESASLSMSILGYDRCVGKIHKSIF